MSEKRKCSRCKHKQPRTVCGCRESPFAGQVVQPVHVCEWFVNNPAQEYLSEALARGIFQTAEDTRVSDIEDTADLYEKALNLGLPQDDEVLARAHLGACYLDMGSRRQGGSIEAGSAEFQQALEEMEAALVIDTRGGYGTFADPLKRAGLQRLACLYIFQSEAIGARAGLGEEIAYLEGKLNLFEHLPSPPPILLLRLAERYESSGESVAAKSLLSKILEAPENPVGDADREIREIAAAKLSGAQGQEAEKSGCFIATVAFGSSNSAEVHALRRFRDVVLAARPAGQVFIAFYYRVSPTVARLLGRSRTAQGIVRAMLHTPLWLVRHLLPDGDES